MRAHATNAMYGALDYAAYPVGMLLAAPAVLRGLGSAEFGVWAFTMATVNTGAILASGFGDANIQQVASARGLENRRAVENAVRSTLGIHFVLGVAIATASLLLAPTAAAHVAGGGAAQRNCLDALRLASALMLLRALETVAVSTQRAFERYGAAVALSVSGRLVSLAATAWLAMRGASVATILGATTLIVGAATAAQFVQLQSLLRVRLLRPNFDLRSARSLVGFGVFSWLQAATGAVFGQADRVFLGLALGAAAVTPYALCVQLAQPVYGLSAAALHFVFPSLARSSVVSESGETRRKVLLAVLCNALLVAIMASPLLLFGRAVMERWVGVQVAQASAPLLPALVLGSAMVGLSVTGVYALMAFGRVRTAAWIGIASGGLMLATMPLALHHWGIAGVAATRVEYGLASLAVYVPLLCGLSGREAVRRVPPVQPELGAAFDRKQEGVQP